jgi:hypothetical protein
VIIKAVLAIFAATSSVISISRDELGALALLASAVSVFDCFSGIVDAIVFHVFTPCPLLFATSSLFGCFRTHQNPLLREGDQRLSALSSTFYDSPATRLGM